MRPIKSNQSKKGKIFKVTESRMAVRQLYFKNRYFFKYGIKDDELSRYCIFNKLTLECLMNELNIHFSQLKTCYLSADTAIESYFKNRRDLSKLIYFIRFLSLECERMRRKQPLVVLKRLEDMDIPQMKIMKKTKDIKSRVNAVKGRIPSERGADVMKEHNINEEQSSLFNKMLLNTENKDLKRLKEINIQESADSNEEGMEVVCETNINEDDGKGNVFGSRNKIVSKKAISDPSSFQCEERKAVVEVQRLEDIPYPRTHSKIFRIDCDRSALNDIIRNCSVYHEQIKYDKKYKELAMNRSSFRREETLTDIQDICVEDKRKNTHMKDIPYSKRSVKYDKVSVAVDCKSNSRLVSIERGKPKEHSTTLKKEAEDLKNENISEFGCFRIDLSSEKQSTVLNKMLGNTESNPKRKKGDNFSKKCTDELSSPGKDNDKPLKKRRTERDSQEKDAFITSLSEPLKTVSDISIMNEIELEETFVVCNEVICSQIEDDATSNRSTLNEVKLQNEDESHKKEPVMSEKGETDLNLRLVDLMGLFCNDFESADDAMEAQVVHERKIKEDDRKTKVVTAPNIIVNKEGKSNTGDPTILKTLSDVDAEKSRTRNEVTSNDEELVEEVHLPSTSPEGNPGLNPGDDGSADQNLLPDLDFETP